MSKKELNGHKVGDAISDSTRVEILQHLLKVYPNSLTMSEIEKTLSKHVSPTTISFHLRKEKLNLSSQMGIRRGLERFSQQSTLQLTTRVYT
jgi:DNA-binding transcriptional ArsR family regulator